MEIADFLRPRSIDEAYRLLTEKKAFLVGGGAWSRRSSRKVALAVDLSTLDLRYIRKREERIEIGAMATARDVETSALLEEAYGSLFRDALAHIVGVQMRNIVSVGGTVAGRYGFSDLNTVFLALNARLVLYKVGEVEFENLLTEQRRGPVLIEKIVLDGGTGAFRSLRHSRSDLPVLNAAVAFAEGAWRIAVGARPGPARLAKAAAALLGKATHLDAETIEKAARAAAEELSFQTDIRATSDYRRSLCAVLVRRAISEVSK